MTAVTWDGLDARELARRCGVPRLELFAEIESTQDVAHRLAEAGAPGGTVVLADAQSAGRGRMGRSWQSKPGSGVWCTIIERPNRASNLDVLSLRVGLHCANALDPFAGERVGLKWPNDLVLPGVMQSGAKEPQFRKVCGVLVEVKWSGEHLVWVCIGIGVNVRPPQMDGAVGLAEATDRAPVLAAIVRAARAAAASPGPLTYSELKRFAERDVLAGRRIVAPADGIVRGITAAGSLVVQSNRGVEEVRTGTVQLAVAQEEPA
jgi:BirA family biotin operon repressor/biotin-[acetyl-CoA-carboxylase] ligase